MVDKVVVAEKDLRVLLTRKFKDDIGDDSAIIFLDSYLKDDDICNISFTDIQTIYDAYEKKVTSLILESVGLLSETGNFILNLSGFKTHIRYCESNDLFVSVTVQEDNDENQNDITNLSNVADELCNYLKQLLSKNFNADIKVKCYKMDLRKQKLKLLIRKTHHTWTSYEENVVYKMIKEDRFSGCICLDPNKVLVDYPCLLKRQQLLLSVKLSLFDSPAYVRMEKVFKMMIEKLQNWSIVVQSSVRRQLMTSIKEVFRKKSIDLFEEEDNGPVDPMQRLEVPKPHHMFLFGKKIRRVIALIVVDIQNDFISGNLALRNAPAKEDGAEVVPVINQILADNEFDLVVFTQDWHPPNHCSFITNIDKYAIHPCSKVTVDNAKVFDRVVYDGETVLVQEMWPVHCVQGSYGAKFHKDLQVPDDSIILQKGQNPNIDAYSAFWDNARKQQSKLKAILRERRITTVVIAGIATDYCVGATAVHSAEFGFDTYVVLDACRGIDKKEIEIRSKQMENRGVKLIFSKEIPQGETPWISIPPATPGPSGFTEDTITLKDLLDNFLIMKRMEDDFNHPHADQPNWFRLGVALSKVVDIKEAYLQRLKNRELSGGGDPTEHLFSRIKIKFPELKMVDFHQKMLNCGRKDICTYLDQYSDLPELFSELSYELTEFLSGCLNTCAGPGWDVFAAEMGFTTSDIDLIRGASRQSGYMYSPCKNLLMKLVQVSPDLKVRVLLDCLRHIERYDTVKFLSESIAELNQQRLLNKRSRFKTF